MMAAYPNPVLGAIYPKGSTPPAGAFRVTRTSADHVATNQGKGIDVSNGRCDGKVLAIAAGRVTKVDRVQGIVRIDHAVNADEAGYAHMDPILVAVGQAVTTGQPIGVVNDAHDPSITNFAGCHLHFGIVRGGMAIDPWPELAQNQGGDMAAPIPTAQFKHIVNRKTKLKAQAPLYVEPRTGASHRTFPVGTGCQPVSQVRNAAGTWYGCWMYDDAPSGYVFGYFIGGALEPLVVNENPPGPESGFTQEQVDAAVKAAKHSAAAAVSAAADSAAGNFPP